jgi:hypothetical protein
VTPWFKSRVNRLEDDPSYDPRNWLMAMEKSQICPSPLGYQRRSHALLCPANLRFGLNQPRGNARLTARWAFTWSVAFCCRSWAAITWHASQRFLVRDLVV